MKPRLAFQQRDRRIGLRVRGADHDLVGEVAIVERMDQSSRPLLMLLAIMSVTALF